jgi:hypothetical protein
MTDPVTPPILRGRKIVSPGKKSRGYGTFAFESKARAQLAGKLK